MGVKKTTWGGGEPSPDRSDTEATAQLRREPMYLHVALHYFKPYRSTYEVLELLKHTSINRAVFRKTHTYRTEIEMFAEMDLDASWEASIFSIVSNRQPVAPLMPSQCLAEGPSLPSDGLWPPPPPKKRGFPKGQKCRPRAAAAPDPDLEIQASESHREGSDSADQGREGGSSADDEEQVSEGIFSESEESDAVVSDLGDLDALLDQAIGSWHGGVEPAADPGAVESQALPRAEEEAHEDEELVEAVIAPDQVEPPVPRAAEAAQAPGQLPGEVVAADEGVPDHPPPAAAPEDAPDRVRHAAEVVCILPGGRITWYRQGFFTAQCQNPAHGRCVLTRSSEEGRRAPQGRPLGLLAGWLARGLELPDKASHWLKTNWPSLEQRQHSRALLDDAEGGPELLDCERPQRPEEGPEPDLQP